MAAARQEFEIGAALLGLYRDHSHVKKLWHSIGELGDRILVRVIIGVGCSAIEFREYTIEAVGRAMCFEGMMPACTGNGHEVVSVVADRAGGLRHLAPQRP